MEMFKLYGFILLVRVLIYKNCGFVNFEWVDSVIFVKNIMNGKEIFFGVGFICINFVKFFFVFNMLGYDGVMFLFSFDLFFKGQDNFQGMGIGVFGDFFFVVFVGIVMLIVFFFVEMIGDIFSIVVQFGVIEEDKYNILVSFQWVIQYGEFVDEIFFIKEFVYIRIYDVFKFWDICKRIDNQVLFQVEIESIVVDMFFEIVEFFLDYFGNMVVQKFFEYCFDDVCDQMLVEIVLYMVEIGVYKNGIWVVQKIIEVCKILYQMNFIVQYLCFYMIFLFLDQYGNYVFQGCLKFGSFYNDFIFEIMLSRMWEVVQG